MAAQDFIVDPYQFLRVSSRRGRAILLIAEALDGSALIDLQILATELNLTTLIEVHDMDNLIRVRDPSSASPTAATACWHQQPRPAHVSRPTSDDAADGRTRRGPLVLVSESGIHSNADIRKLRRGRHPAPS